VIIFILHFITYIDVKSCFECCVLTVSLQQDYSVVELEWHTIILLSVPTADETDKSIRCHLSPAASSENVFLYVVFHPVHYWLYAGK